MSRSNQKEYVSKAERVNSSRAGRRRRKRRREALLIGAVFVFVCVVALLGLSMLLKVSTIQVENPAVNRRAVAARLCKTLPYVGSAQVRVKFPDTVAITVTYTEARIYVATPSGYTLLNAAGKVLQTGADRRPENVAELLGAEVHAAVPGETVVFEGEDTLKNVTSLTLAFEENGITGVTALDLTDLGNVTAELNYDTLVRLGSISKAAGKLAFGKEVIDRTLSQPRGTSAMLVIDLTQDDSAYVRTQDDIDEAESRRNAPEPETDENGEVIVTEPEETLGSVG